MKYTKGTVPKALVFLLTGIAVASLLASCGSGHAENKKNTIAQGIKVSVSVAKPQWTSNEEVLSVNGEIRAKEEVQVVAETNGKVIAVKVDAGSRVAAGDILAVLDDEVKKANLVAAQANYDKVLADYTRALQLFEQKVISDSDLQGSRLASVSAEAQLTSVRRDHENTRIRSPLSGLVTERNVSVGTMLNPGVPVARVIDIARLKLLVAIPENSILKLKKGQSVTIEANTWPGYTFTGSVFAISPKSSSSLSFPVEIDLRNDPAHQLYDGMLATAKIKLGKRSIWSIPRKAIVGSLQKPQVFVEMNGVALLKDIVVGSEFGEDKEVISGLEKEDQVIVNGQNNLEDGMAVEIVTGSQP